MKSVKYLISIISAFTLPTAVVLGTLNQGIINPNDKIMKNKNLGITNGHDAKYGSAPWFSSVAYKLFDNKLPQGNLAGALISPNWIVSCAHCVNSLVQWGAVTITNSYSDVYVNYMTTIIDHSSKIIINPNYASHGHFNYDISLIKLAHPIYSVKPIALPTVPLKINDKVSVYGFGQDDPEGDHSNTLKVANIKVDDPKAVAAKFGSLNKFNSKNEYLAGPLTGKRVGAALGDSGGPLVKNINGQNVLEGIVSRGIKLYSYGWIKPEPGIYTSVYASLNWIKQTIAEN